MRRTIFAVFLFFLSAPADTQEAPANSAADRERWSEQVVTDIVILADRLENPGAILVLNEATRQALEDNPNYATEQRNLLISRTRASLSDLLANPPANDRRFSSDQIGNLILLSRTFLDQFDVANAIPMLAEPDANRSLPFAANNMADVIPALITSSRIQQSYYTPDRVESGARAIFDRHSVEATYLVPRLYWEIELAFYVEDREAFDRLGSELNTLAGQIDEIATNARAELSEIQTHWWAILVERSDETRYYEPSRRVFDYYRNMISAYALLADELRYMSELTRRDLTTVVFEREMVVARARLTRIDAWWRSASISFGIARSQMDELIGDN